MAAARYGGHNYFQEGGPNPAGYGNDNNNVESPYPAEMFSNVTTHQQALDLLKGQRQASGAAATPEQQLKLTNVGDQAYFDALQKNTGLAFKHTSDNGSDTWSPIEQTPQAPTPNLSDKPFVPGFKYEDDKLFQKRQGRVTGEEHWQASNPAMAKMYAQKYGTGDMTGRELQAAIATDPEAFVNSFGQPAKEAQLASITLKPNSTFAYGGATLRKAQAGGVVPEADYTTAADANASNFDASAYINAPQQNDPSLPAPANYVNAPTTPPYGRTPAALQLWAEQDPQAFGIWAETNNYGPAIETSSKATRSQSVPSSQKLEASGNAKWDMTSDGYDEAAVEAGDYVKKADGKWYKVTGYSKKNSAYTGDYTNDKLVGNVSDNQEKMGRLQQRIEENPELREAIVKQYKATIKKVKPGKNLTEADIAVARGMDDEEIIDNFYRAQEQIMAVDAHKGKLNDTTGSWDKDRNLYTDTIGSLGFDPMTPGETAAFQATYIGLQNLSKDKTFKKDLEDFKVAPVGKADEGPSGKMNVSDVDGWFGNTTVGQAVLYRPMAKQMEMEEAEWLEEKKTAEKHLGIERGAQKTPFWTEDIINLAGAARNLFSIQKERPWNATPGMKLPNATFQSPDQQIQNILGATNTGAQMAGAFGSPQAYAANFAAIQGNAMQQVANAIGNVADRNVQVANQFELQRANIMNRSNERKAQLATNLHDKHAILNQQFRNSKTQAWNEVREGMVNMWTNRGQTQNMNTFNDQYYIDPRTGYKHFRDPRKIIPKDSQRPDIAGQVNDLVGAVPGLDPNQALRYYSKNADGQPFSPTGNMGVDPTQTGPTWPGGAPSGYQ
jgi:hypothetical protein